MVEVQQLTTISETGLVDINRLLGQLRSDQNNMPTTMQEVKEILANKHTVVVAALDGEHIAGIASLYIMQKMGKRVGTVEDVVVDETYRGQGLGEKIMRALIEIAGTRGLRSLHLTSRPERVAANKLYQKLGFVWKETNPYRLQL